MMAEIHHWREDYKSKRLKALFCKALTVFYNLRPSYKLDIIYPDDLTKFKEFSDVSTLQL